MKSFFVSAASAVALLGAFSGSASAQLAAIDLDAVLGLPGTIIDATGDIVVLPETGIDALLPGAGALIAGNTALVTAPITSAATQIAVPLDLTGVLVDGGLAAAIGATPNTVSGAAVIGALDVAVLGGSNVAGNVTQTTVGQIGNQVSQSALVTNGTTANDFALDITAGTLVATDEASQAAAQVGSGASNSAARFATLSVATPAVSITDNTIAFDTAEAIAGIYQGNIALVTAPITSIATQIGVTNTVGNVSQTTVGQIGTQVSSVGLDAAAVTAAITGE